MADCELNQSIVQEIHLKNDELAELRDQLGSDHPDVVRLRNEIRGLRHRAGWIASSDPEYEEFKKLWKSQGEPRNAYEAFAEANKDA